MVHIQKWVEGILPQLQQSFGPRLQYLGLQGSYRRREATKTSDIDLVVLLDTVNLDDLDVYRNLVRAMPEGHKACGFICGLEEFALWPKNELFPFKMDTADYFGRLEDFLPPISAQDVKQGAKIEASGLIHMLRHSYLYAGMADRTEILRGAFKSAFFVMQIQTYCTTGLYHCSKKALLEAVSQSPCKEKEIITASLNPSAWLESHTAQDGYNLLLDWCCGILAS